MGAGRTERLGRLLVEEGWISEADLQAVLAEQGRRPERIGLLLVEMGMIGERTLLETLARQRGLEIAEIPEGRGDPKVLERLPYAVAKRYRAVPLAVEGRVLHVAMADPLDAEGIQALEFATGMRVRASLCSEREVDLAVEQYYGMAEAVDRLVTSVEREARLDGTGAVSILEAGPPGRGGIAEPGGEAGRDASTAPIIRLVNLVLTEAVRREASDVHLEPTRKGLQVRFRIDGILRRRMSIPRALQQAVVSRIKVTARMDIAKRRIPQDGGFRLRVEGRRVDLRVSSLPTFYGEKIVIRLLDQTDRAIDLASLGMGEGERKALVQCYRRPQGMILVTGPTGSGKSTTLHAILRDLRSEGVNIVTVEDPVEYELEGVNQVQVQKEAGLTFADSLRAILRQDPNVIMVGEIRDTETAEVAFRAALTGHLVLSTLHTNDTVSTVTRLVDMGVPRFLIGSALLAVVSQRLVRRICEDCREPAEPEGRVPAGMAPELVSAVGGLFRGRGCSRCARTGYRGRIGLFELLVLSPAIREGIAGGAAEGELRRRAVEEGMRTLLEDALEKVRGGVTTLQEVAGLGGWEEADLLPGGPDRIGEGADARAPGSPGRPTIVFAEDDPEVREAVALTLEALSCEVLLASDGREAWEMIRRRSPCLVITDIQMPGMDGYELLKRIRSRRETASVQVLLLTAKNRCEDRMRGFLLGGDDYLEKPFDHRELLARVKRCLDRVALFHGQARAFPLRPPEG